MTGLHQKCPIILPRLGSLTGRTQSWGGRRPDRYVQAKKREKNEGKKTGLALLTGGAEKKRSTERLERKGGEEEGGLKMRPTLDIKDGWGKGWGHGRLGGIDKEWQPILKSRAADYRNQDEKVGLTRFRRTGAARGITKKKGALPVRALGVRGQNRPQEASIPGVVWGKRNRTRKRGKQGEFGKLRQI